MTFICVINKMIDDNQSITKSLEELRELNNGLRSCCISWSSSLRCNLRVFDQYEKETSRACQVLCECHKHSTSLIDSSAREENNKLNIIWFIYSKKLCLGFGFVTSLESLITIHGAMMLPSRKPKSSWLVNRGTN
jgi:histidinol phosphatase-like enzyme